MDQHSQQQPQSIDWFQQFLQVHTRTQQVQTKALVAQQKHHDELMSLLATRQSILPADRDSDSEAECRENLNTSSTSLNVTKKVKTYTSLSLHVRHALKLFISPKSEWKSFLSTKLTLELIDQVANMR